MEIQSLCRICRTAGINMKNINQDSKILGIYERITGIKTNTNDDTPKSICFICHAQLRKNHNFVTTVLVSNQMFMYHLYGNNYEKNALQATPIVNLKSENILCTTITDDHPNVNKNYICIQYEPIITVKIEIEVEECSIDDTEIKSEPLETEYIKPKKDDPIACKICNKQYLNKDYLKAHMIVHGQRRNAIPFSCRNCLQKFFVLHNWMRHIKICDGTRPRFTCSICNCAYPSRALAAEHMAIHRNQVILNCDRCSKFFTNQSGFIQHMKTHNETKPFMCEKCGKRFYQYGNLKIHLHVHTGEKKFVCPVCSWAFRSKGNLKTHMRRHTKEKPYLCTDCGMSFSYHSALRLHIKNRHTAGWPFHCDLCNWSFKTERLFVNHRKSHEHKYQFQCKVCKKKFRNERFLRDHADVHSNVRSKRCKLCGELFKRRTHLSQHMKTKRCRDKATQLKQESSINEVNDGRMNVKVLIK